MGRERQGKRQGDSAVEASMAVPVDDYDHASLIVTVGVWRKTEVHTLHGGRGSGLGHRFCEKGREESHQAGPPSSTWPSGRPSLTSTPTVWIMVVS